MFFFPSWVLLKHWLTKRTQTSFAGNYWQMNFQNTLKRVFFFKVLTFSEKVNVSWLTDFSFQHFCHPKNESRIHPDTRGVGRGVCIFCILLTVLTESSYDDCLWLDSRMLHNIHNNSCTTVVLYQTSPKSQQHTVCSEHNIDLWCTKSCVGINTVL